ncbi:uncharacterized protein [Halyomorpha halys]|uniref:uncharacterized protein n=1 Tax=Halyomorpha halys TaxID=286706 RepID=UPI0006D52294|nr:uncharacterized protein LOC106685584 [Halyomorpha halys]
MITKCTVLVLTLGLAAGFTLRSDVTRSKRDAPYRGPPAPLNHDGTVAFTAEFLQANDVHNAAYAEEYQRLQVAAALAAAHPDRTSPLSKDYNPQDNGQYNSHDNEQPVTQQEDDGQYRPHLYENTQSTQQYSSPAYVSHQPQVSYQGASQQQYNPVAYNAAPYHPTTQPNQQLFSPAPQHHIPAPLNPDGTVAQTPEYNALAASLHNTYQQALTRHRRSLNHYQGPPAPLNHDGTVANTPEIEHAIAVHKAAYAKQYQKLHEAEMLAAAHPDITSSDHYEPHSDDGDYSQQYESLQDDGLYKSHLYASGDYNFNQNNHDSTIHYSQAPSGFNPEAHIPAPLNHDGTVAHTAEYKAIAASHKAEYEKALQNTKYHMMAPQYQHESSFSNSYW